ncbi:hypothetical protein F5B22DRAFT_641694 [Xylaria bambusicola]|uniref:uncharacterized protein n=1 Tax=Xylaria bambusicola TaxID=326684 RepID=UPI002007CD3B|nr:uncharacterized protein F5B22DRAFT_641694 [Xylaria bambusicola]KAI0526548.1 hypothetical protein F5B22DRAFT_641694 [Xylaria bambusicola]
MLAEQGSLQPSSKTFIACSRCKIRKKKCDGGSPKCSNCATHNAECIYATVRRTRGTGKKFRESNDDLNLENVDSKRRPEGEEQAQLVTPGPLPVPISNTESSFFRLPPDRPDSTSRLPIVPDFLLPDNFRKNLASSFAEITDEHQFISLESFMQLFEEQYAASTDEPAGGDARWALMNVVVAMALRSKTAVGGESSISPLIQSFHLNAAMVAQRVIYQDPNLLSVQALLAMAVFSCGIPDPQAFGMLVTNALYQLEILGRKQFGGLLGSEEDEYWQVNQVSMKLSEGIGLRI